ncbi:MAG: transglycosylase SLT domain-containing protein [Chitinophagales bacterium]|nr:transglycosylase SLT domain-containing protein [Chitinophagales bacterium]
MLKKLILSIYIVFLCNAMYAQIGPGQWKDNPNDLKIPTEEQLFKDDPDPAVLSAQVSVRLKKIQRTVPLDYNKHVQKYIDYYVTRKTHVSKVLGRSTKFFPIFESILAQNGMPEEIKYLAVVESALNPYARSYVGATGLWQFMYGTALQYKLSINKRVDERKDPYKSCEAACAYLKKMYNIYGNWHLAIASYNCGPGNVNKAIAKAGGSKDFWKIKPYLPKETQGYVPSFIAIIYAMKYANKYGISPEYYDFEQTERITLKDKMSVYDLNKILNIPVDVIRDENPSLLTTIIPKGFTLNLPVDKWVAFNAYQDSLYTAADVAIVDEKLSTPVVVIPKSAVSTSSSNVEPVSKPKSKTKKKEEALVKAEDIPVVTKTKNKKDKSSKKDKKEKETIADNTQKEKTKTTTPVVAPPIVSKTKPNTSKQKTTTIQSTPEKVKIKVPEIEKENDDNYQVIVYTVKSGDNLGFIAEWFHCKVKDIKRWNNINGTFIDVNQELIIYIHKNDYNSFAKFNYLSNRLKSIISAKMITTEEKEALQTSKEQNDSISVLNPKKYIKAKTCYEYYAIKAGENLWLIAQKYDDVTVQDLKKWNNFTTTPTLKPGQKIKVRQIPCN